ncbi:MAG: lipopolysaccharide transport periplasmic protein LptA [Sneathiella sp.]|nr:lipopolysaccharide transport periplasmic protein LptA [Sneathiella sp.]
MISNIAKNSKLAALALVVSLSLGVAPLFAQSALSSSGFDTDKPIEILADSLEVQQDKQIAIFEGNVQVIQGDIRLKSSKLRVYYADKSATKSSKGTDQPPSIRKIEATGNVFLSSPRETAKGDTGTYDVVNKRIHLVGNVVLTQGQNVLKGQSMVLDLVSGKSRIEGTGAGNTKGRVRGIFVPQKKTE